MTKKTTTAEPVKREVGEKVTIQVGLEPGSVKALGDGIFEVIVTTSQDDRHREQIITSGIDTKAYEETNPVVLYGHDYWALPIGKSLKLTKMANKIKSKFQLAVEEYDFAATVAAMIKGGYLNTASIGGIVRKWSDDYKQILEMEMVEFSIVPVPANPGAVITGRSIADIAGKSVDKISQEYEEFVKRSMVDKVAEMPDDEVQQAIKSLETVMAALKDNAQHKSSAGEPQVPEQARIKRLRLLDSAKAVNRESERVIRTIKLKKD